MSREMPNLGPKPETEEVQTSYERSDNRWDIAHANRDWMIIAVLVVVYLIWTGVLFLFEPGLR